LLGRAAAPLRRTCRRRRARVARRDTPPGQAAARADRCTGGEIPVRIAIAVEGTRGDVHPMLALARRLLERGHDVALCAPPDFADDAAAQGVPFHAVGVNVRAYLEKEADFLHGSPVASLRAVRRYFHEAVQLQFRGLAAAVPRADWLVSAGTQLAAASVAEAIGARHRFVAYCPSLLRSPHQTPAFLPVAALRPWQNRLAWWATLCFFSGALRGIVDGERRTLGLAPAPRDLYGLLLGAAPVLAAEEMLAPAPEDLTSAVQVVGCLHPYEETPLPEKLDAFLRAGEPPVYLGFGSMTDPDPDASTRLVLEAVERAGARALLSAGWAGLGDAALPENVMVVGSVPHAALFPRVAAVVHHGGAGTTTTAARAGVPQILVPHILDQFHWAHRVALLGLGPPALPRRRLCAERLAEAIVATRDNELVAERAASLGVRLRDTLRARPHPADVLFGHGAC
jgi:UDP:flavonoid glycosyltransferase YjiC (YdhE family)